MNAGGAACAGAGDSTDDPAAHLRSKLGRLIGHAWTPNHTGGARSQEVFAPSRVGGVYDQIWGGADAHRVLARRAEMGDGCPSLVVYVQATEAMSIAPLLDAAMPVFARRARQTSWPVNSGGWVSPSEQVVLDHLVLGLSVREVATLLEKSPHTVHDQVKSLHRKLHATTRAMLVARALGHTKSGDGSRADGMTRS